jgi:glutamine cyclotransferase
MLAAFLPAAASAVQQYEVQVINKKPQSRDNYVQGLEIRDGYLYVSTGLYGRSHLLRYDFTDVSLDLATKLDSRIFGEGLTVFGDRVFQLTWRARKLLVYDKRNLQSLQTFAIPGEGWGLTNDGEALIYSVGGDKLHFMSPTNGEILRTLVVTEQGQRVTQLNELEWIDGAIWANIWRTNRIVIIDPDTGKVTGNINLTGLLPQKEYNRGTDVLNGIAQNPADGTIWVTGKRWPWLYQIELLPKAAISETQQPGQISR